MNFRTTLFLLILVAIVGGTLLFITHRDEKEKKSDKVDDHKLVDMDSNDVTRVSITAADDRHTVLEKSGAEWKLVQPVAARAKGFEVDGLVSALLSLHSREELDASKKTSGGLDHPSFVVELTAKSGKTAKLSFGDSSSVGDSLYVLVNDSTKPAVVGNGIYATLDKPASTYRDMKLIATPTSDIKQLAITQKGKTIKLEKDGQDWKITAPANIPAEASVVTDIVAGLSSIEASEFEEAPSAAATGSLAHPRLVVSFSTRAPTTQPAAGPATTQPAEVELPGGQTLRFGGYKDILKKNLFASVGGKDVAIVPTTSEQAFEKTTLDLRNRDVANITPDHVSSLTVAINRPATTQPTTRPAELREFTIERHKIAAPVLGPALPPGTTAPTTQPAAIAATQPSTPATPPSAVTTTPAPSGAVATTQPSAPASGAVATTQPSTPAATPGAVATTQPSTPATQPGAVASTQPSTPTTQPTTAAVATTQPATQPDEMATAKWIFTSGGAGVAEEGQVVELLAALHPLRAEKYIEPTKAAGASYTLTIHTIPATAGENAEDYVLTFVETETQVEAAYKDLHFTVDRGLIEKLTGDFKTRKAPPSPPPSDMMPPGFRGGAGHPPFGG